MSHIDKQFHALIFVVSGPASQSPVRRRTSVSSMEDSHPELDDSYHDSPSSPKSPRGTLSKLSNTFNNLRESFSSSAHDPDNTVWTARSDYAYDIRLLFKRRITNLYISFTNLRSYVEINYSGFRKILKKYVFLLSVLCDIVIWVHASINVGYRVPRFSQLPRLE